MTKDAVVALGVARRNAEEFFDMLGIQNTATDPEERAMQTERYERARADMWEARNRHEAGLRQLGHDDPTEPPPKLRVVTRD